MASIGISSSDGTNEIDFEFNLDGLLQSPLCRESPLPPRSVTSESSPRSSNRSSQAPPLTPTRSQLPLAHQALDGRCIKESTQIICYLENYLMANVKVFSITLESIMRAVDHLNRLIMLQQASKNPRCLAIFGVVLLQLIELLERGCAHFFEQAPSATSPDSKEIPSGSAPSGGLLNFGYGAYEEEQRAMDARLIVRGIQRSSEVLQKIKKLSSLTGDDARYSSSRTVEERERRFVDFEYRLSMLTTQMLRSPH